MTRTKTIHSIPPSLKSELKKAISDWVASLPAQEAKKKSLFLDGTAYTPSQILNEIERETPFGTEFLAGLAALNDQMSQENPGASILELIRASMKQASS